MLRLGHACAVIVLLAACGRPPELIEPKAEATTSARPTKASPTAAPPTMPPIAKRHDEIGAANFVLYWVKVSNYAASTGDTRRLREISEPDCEGCNRYIDLYEKTYAAGGYFRGSDWKLSQLSSESDGDTFLIRAHVTAPVGQFRNTSSERTRHGNAEDSDLGFLVNREARPNRLAELILQSEIG